MERTFQVDLRGIVDLLSHHLYSSPQVFLREVLQNGVDAIAARQGLHPQWSGRIGIETIEHTGDGTLRIHDNGIGLTEDEVHTFLATIGNSSKRDELGFTRQEFLGQFGIGLLSCFLVSDHVRVLTRSARGGPTLEWLGRSSGQYSVTRAAVERPEPGTTVVLSPRPDHSRWFEYATVLELARKFGGLLPVPVSVAGTPVAVGTLPWQVPYRTAAERTAALYAYAEQTFGFRPLDCLDLSVAEAGLTGVAFILPVPANPAVRGGHRVYLRRMLLGDEVTDLLPEWAFFARCVVDTTELRPTASRESLYSDDLLVATRRALGSRIRDWLVTMSVTDPSTLHAFLAVHHLGVKALALHDDAMLRLVFDWWPMETGWGPMTLAEFCRRSPVVRYTTTADEFRELAAVAAAQGIGLINGGYTYDVAIMNRLTTLDPALVVRGLDPTELATRFDAAPEDDPRVAYILGHARQTLASLDCVPVAKSFDPAQLPALFLADRDVYRSRERSETKARTDGLWADVLAAVEPADQPEGTHQLVLNLRNPIVVTMLDLTDPHLIGLAIESLFAQALLQGRHPLGATESALMNRSFSGLLQWAMRGQDAIR
ncbi:HSP90 family protein [Nocardia sp. GTS18]|uniref:HSP90 family protein n=1 Tax=unclassified Nocardia TaxID=2637762 RepID=UPI0015EEA71D